MDSLKNKSKLRPKHQTHSRLNKEEAKVMDNYEAYDLAQPVDLDAIGEPVVGDAKEDVSMTKKPGQLFKKRGAGVKKNKRKHKKVTRKHKKTRKTVKKNKKRQTRKMKQKKMMKGGEIFSGVLNQARVRDVAFYVSIEDGSSIVNIREDIRSGIIDAGLIVNDIIVSLLNERYEGKNQLLVEVTLPLDIDINSSGSDYVLTEDALMEFIDLIESSDVFGIEGVEYNGPHEDTFEED